VAQFGDQWQALVCEHSNELLGSIEDGKFLD
jgi:hypothetical protein